MPTTESTVGSASRNRCETRSLLYFSFPNERKITARQEIESKSHRPADGRTCRASNALRPLHHLRIQRPRPAGRSGRAGSRKPERKDRSPRARALAVLDRRCSWLASLRLPCAARIVAEKNRPGILGNSALSSAGRPRHRLDEQTAGLRTARRRNGHGGSE